MKGWGENMGKLGEAFKNRRLKTAGYGIMLGLVCQIYIAPFAYSNHVVSLGTPVLSALLLFQPELPVFPLSLVMSVTACVLRGLIGAAGGMVFSEMFLPALFYYGSYSLLLGCCFKLLKRYGKARLMAGMIFCDFAANTIQLAFMGHIEGEAVVNSVLVAVIRGLLVWMVYWMYEWENLYIRKKEHQSHYAELSYIVSDIYAESFYLKKSMEDLNDLTRKSHQLYEDMEAGGKDGQAALDIAREAHEIRKDYQRIVQGISNLVHEHEEKSMRLSHILQIIEDNTKRQISERGQKLSLKVRCQSDMQIHQYYDIFTILNNLIVNSMDACGETGHISLTAEEKDGMLCLTVSDDGCGIDEDMQPYIWGAGFSTKYDKETGQMSTGIGLCHVANAAAHLGGTVDVASSFGNGTKFSIRLPAGRIQEESRNLQE